MRLSEHRYLKLAEELTELASECNEAAKRCLKLIQFGGDEVQPGQELTNGERLQAEANDVLAMMYLMDLLPDFNHDEFDPIHKLAYKKGEKLAKYLDYSRKCGTIDDK